MIAAIYVPLWLSGLVFWLLLLAWIVWNDHRARARARRRRRA